MPRPASCRPGRLAFEEEAIIYRVLFICMGNICRSPAAETVVRALVERAGMTSQVEVDSAGTHAYHADEAPDARMRKAATRRSYDMRGLRARALTADDFRRFDRVLAMDRQNFEFARRLCSPEWHDKLGMFIDCAVPATGEREIPDPYYGGAGGFEHVLDLCEIAGRGLVAELQAKFGHDGKRR